MLTSLSTRFASRLFKGQTQVLSLSTKYVRNYNTTPTDVPAADSEIDPYGAGKKKGKMGGIPKNLQENNKPSDDPMSKDKVSSTITSNLNPKQPNADATPLNARKFASTASTTRRNDGVNHPTSKNTTRTSSGKTGQASAGVNSMYKSSNAEPAKSPQKEQELQNSRSQRTENQENESQAENEENKSPRTAGTKTAGPKTFSASGNAREFHSSTRHFVRDNPGAPGTKVPEAETHTKKASEKVQEARRAADAESESHHPSAKERVHTNSHHPLGSESEQDVAADRSEKDPRKNGDHLKQG